MTRSRPRTFGPLFYTTLAVGILVLIPFGAWKVSERYRDWRAGRRLDDRIDRLELAVRDPDAEARGQAAAGFRDFIGDQPLFSPEQRSRIIATLRPLLDDPETWVRVEGAHAIAWFGEKGEARSRLIGILADEDPEVRYAAAKALMAIVGPKDPDAVRVLMSLFTEQVGTIDRRMLLEDLLLAGEGIPKAAIDTLAGEISRGGSLERHEALALLSQIGDRAEGTAMALRGLLEDEDPQLRRLAALEIVRLEGKGAPPAAFAILLGTVIDPGQVLDDRLGALVTLHEANPEEMAKAGPDLVRQLGDPSQDIRLAAHELLFGIVEVAPAMLSGAGR